MKLADNFPDSDNEGALFFFRMVMHGGAYAATGGA